MTNISGRFSKLNGLENLLVDGLEGDQGFRVRVGVR